ncbi:MAG: hybrid sensor histidine kinase/response regulator [Chloroflexi bacterium]|nr:hybrid sensor histidine kinase/response regulator [Chloroflexota bacterium]
MYDIKDKKQHILVVEDDTDLLNGIAELLTINEFDVSTATHGREGLDALRRMTHPPDLIISDIYMPVMDGFEFLERVRQRTDWIGVPFIFLTARGSKQDIHEGFVRGAEDYIVKPFEFNDLVMRVRSRLDRHAQLRALQSSQLDQIRQRILTVINHEVRTPLSYIVAYADMLANDPTLPDSETLRQYVTGIQLGTERLHRLTETFLVLAELESGTGEHVYELRSEPILALDGIVTAALGNIQTTVDSSGASVRVELASDLPAVRGDRVYLELAVRHVLDNAIKFSRGQDDPAVWVRIEANGDYVAIVVRDQGRGINPDLTNRLFDMFYQADRESFEQQGIGAGLSIVRHVMNLHKGDVQIESAPGEGTTVMLLLPAVPPPEGG